jgi:hypothetical protein
MVGIGHDGVCSIYLFLILHQEERYQAYQQRITKLIH